MHVFPSTFAIAGTQLDRGPWEAGATFADAPRRLMIPRAVGRGGGKEQNFAVVQPRAAARSDYRRPMRC